MKDSFDFDAKDEKDKPEAEKTKYTKVGKEACGTLTCFKYKVIEPSQTGESTIWFDDRDYKLRQMQNVADGQTTDMKFSYSAPKIEKPSPVKAGNPFTAAAQ